MPPIFQILKCYECSMFQSHQVKKSPKWQCKVCGEKQSVKQRFSIGTAKECRLRVQKLNISRADIDQYELDSNVDTSGSSDDAKVNSPTTENVSARHATKWSLYIDKKDEHNETKYNCKTDDDHSNQNIVLELPKKSMKRAKEFDKKNSKKKYKAPFMESQSAISQSWENYETVQNLNSPSRKSESLCDQNFKSDNLHDKLTNITVKEKQSVENNKINTDCFRSVSTTSRIISKWGQYIEQEKENDVREEEEEFINEVVEPNVLNNVGCAQQILEDSLVDLTDDNKLLDNTERKTNKMLFFMSDDSDIDDVLDF